jgi:hypothetical protein
MVWCTRSKLVAGCVICSVSRQRRLMHDRSRSRTWNIAQSPEDGKCTCLNNEAVMMDGAEAEVISGSGMVL